MEVKNICVNPLVICFSLVSCVGTDPLNQAGQSFIPQLFSGMSFEEYKKLKDKYYPPVGEGEVFAEGCLRDEDGIHHCNGFPIDTTTRLSYSLSEQQVAANCETYQCFPSNLPSILNYNTQSGKTLPVADRIEAGLIDWGLWRGGEEVYIIFDDEKSRLIGIMILGDLELEPFQFFRP